MKLARGTVHYAARSRKPNESCARCSMFVAPHECTLVRGPINPKGWCDRFDAKKDERAEGGRVGYADGGAPFDPDAYLKSAPATGEFNPDAYLGNTSRTGTSDNGWISPVTGIPHEVYEAGKEALTGVNTYLNPMSAEYQTAVENRLKGQGGWTDPGTVLGTGKGLLSAAAAPFSPLTGVARSLIARPYSWLLPTATPGQQQHLRDAGVPEHSIPGSNPEENYAKAKEALDTAMMALGPSKFSATGPRTVPVPARPMPNGPLGVTLSEGQEAGDLAAIQREQAALRNQAGEAAHARADAFAQQQRGEVRNAAERVTQGFDPFGQVVAETPQEAGRLVSEGVQSAAAQRKAAVNAAYERARSMPGEIHAAAFEGIGQKIKGDLSLRSDPVVIDDKLTPFASRAIQDVEQRIANLQIQNRADPFGQPNPQNIVGISLRGVDQMRRRLSSFRNDAYASGNAADGRAAKAVLDAFDDHVDSAINSGLFNGDPRAVQAWNDARAAHADYKSTFTQGKNDPVGRVVERITGKGNNPAAIPNDVADFLYGGSGTNPGTLNLNVARRVRDILGEDSPEWSAVKQGLFQRITDSGPGVTNFGPGKIAQRINKFMNVDGVELANEIYSPAERALINEYANLQRRLEVPQAGANWSNTSTVLGPLVRRVSSGIAGLVGAVIGHAVAPGLYGLGEGIGAAATTKIGSTIGNIRQARQIARQMPLVAERTRNWQIAVARANAFNTPQNKASLGIAAANMAASLDKIGLNSAALLGAAPARADQQQQ